MATFGYTSLGVNSNDLSSGSLNHGLNILTYTASAGDVLTKISIGAKMDTVSSSIGVGLYTFSGGVPVTLVGGEQTISITSTTAQFWDSGTLSINLVAGTTYTLCFGDVNASGNITVMSDTGNSGDGETGSSTGSLPSTWSHLSTSSEKFSIKATVTNTPPYLGTHYYKKQGFQ